MAAEARGHVLEVAVGTGRNFEFYDWGKVTEELVTPEEKDKEEASWWRGKSKVNLKAKKETNQPASPVPARTIRLCALN